MRFNAFAREALASLVVFLVALPLCMGIAIASGVPPAMGLISGIIGGIVVGSIAGSPLQVSGPAAGLIVIVYEVVQNFGLTGLGVVVFAAGLLQILAGISRIGRWFRAIAPAVLYAMLAGIGVLIVASQAHVMVDSTPVASGITNLLTIPSAVIKGITPSADTSHHLAAAVGTTTLAILAVWNAVRKRLPAALAVLPAPLLAVGIATLAAWFFALPIAYVTVPTELSSMLTLISPTELSALADPAMLGAAIALAGVASAESLLSASAVDKLHTGPRTDYDRELIAQGVGNSILGLIGGLPLTGVIVRSTANVDAGGKTRLSAVMHGFWLLIALGAVPVALQAIPVSALAAVLVYIGYKLVNVKVLKTLRAQGRGELMIYISTVSAIVLTSLLEGLLIGLALSVLHLAWKVSHLGIEIEEDGDRVDIRLQGAATFVVLPRLAQALESQSPTAEVHIHLEHLSYIDQACLELIGDWERQRVKQGGTVALEWHDLEARSRRPKLVLADPALAKSA